MVKDVEELKEDVAAVVGVIEAAGAVNGVHRTVRKGDHGVEAKEDVDGVEIIVFLQLLLENISALHMAFYADLGVFGSCCHGKKVSLRDS